LISFLIDQNSCTDLPMQTSSLPYSQMQNQSGEQPLSVPATIPLGQQQQFNQQQQQLQQPTQYVQQQTQQQQQQQYAPPQPQPGAAHASYPPQQPQQQQQGYLHQGLNGGWQSDRDYQERRTMIAKIVHLLQQRKPNAPPEWLRKLPQMAKRLEESLYRSAKSFDEYNDAATLKQRLQLLAVNIGMKTKKLQQQQQQQALLTSQQPQQQQQQQQQGYRPPTQQQQQQLSAAGLPLAQPQSTITPVPRPQPQRMNQQQPTQQSLQQQQMPPQQNRLVNLSEINSIIGGPPDQQQNPTVAAGPTTAAASQSRQVSDRQQVLRHQQQRLLLLRHAAKCQHEDGRCTVTPHCAGMKRLWKHIAECKNQKCQVPHCVSSRYVLSHYHRCKDVQCPVCGPVREAIHRSHEKQKQMQALKQRHQQAVDQQGVVAPPTLNPVQSVAEPPNKRRRSSGGVPLQQGYPGQTPASTATRPLQQPVQSRPGVPAAPLHPGIPAGSARQVPSAPGLAFSNGQVIMPKYSGPKPQEDHTLINCFSVEQIETHLASLNQGIQLSPQKLKTKCLEVLKVLQAHKDGWVFNAPVDPVELGLPDYFEVVKKPMDLGTIRKKLENGVYTQISVFGEHVNLTFDNAMLYNPEGSVVYKMAKDMKAEFEQDFEKLMEQLRREEDIKRRNGEACSLCGCEKLLFEPPVFYCNGLNCPSKRIRRNSYYYVAGNNQYHWCHLCFQDLRDNSTIDLGDITVQKELLVKKKNDEVHEESWVQCDRCERWVHQICALFNTRQNKDQRSEYSCPRCTIEERVKKGQFEGTSTTPMAEDLPRTKLSEYIERHVRKKVDEFVEQQSQELSKNESMPIEDARLKLQMGGAITIRQVTSMDRKLEVRERMKKRYAFKNYPDEFTFRCKCFVVFQNLDGVDVILFGLYVYEHDAKNPAPNSRTVYISYLDSVHFMRPRKMRTFIYHEILIAYLDSVRRRGFSTAHIWACPPLKGDDYILYAKPEDQKTPKDDRLRQWYIDMLIECQKRGVVGKLTNMYDLYFSNPKNDASIVPYMDGDYFPAEVENIIKDIEDGKSGKKNSQKGKDKDQKAKQKKKTGRGGTRSTGLDEEALKASGIMNPGLDKRTLEEGGRDYVMAKLGETIQPMKESFIVAYLTWKGAEPANLEVPKEIKEYREKHGITCEIDEDDLFYGKNHEDNDIESGVPAINDTKAVPIASEYMPFTVKEEESVPDSTTVDNTIGLPKVDARESEPKIIEEVIASSETPINDAKSDVEAVKVSLDSEPATMVSLESIPTPVEEIGALSGMQSEDANYRGEPMEAPQARKPDEAKSDVDVEKRVSPNMQIREGKFAAMAARKRDVNGELKAGDRTEKNEAPSPAKKEKEPRSITVKNSQGRTVKVLDDDEEELDCEFLNNRQAFLNLCQGNHYQFDHLRRAKHSSMMVLWHLHNRDAPKFVQQCATCSREILTGYRFHCSVCADFDQCQECVQNPKIPRHPHQLKPVPIGTGPQNELSAAQRKERQRSIQLHMTLLLHAATCNSPKCPSANCTKMKGLLKHGANCTIKAVGGCNVCKRIWALLQIHARQCKANQCPVPNCMAIRERFRQLKKQQQAMDDRRRVQMNQSYRGKR
jgi:E1A/CREB-binding protein